MYDYLGGFQPWAASLVFGEVPVSEEWCRLSTTRWFLPKEKGKKKKKGKKTQPLLHLIMPRPPAPVCVTRHSTYSEAQESNPDEVGPHMVIANFHQVSWWLWRFLQYHKLTKLGSRRQFVLFFFELEDFGLISKSPSKDIFCILNFPFYCLSN